MRIDKLYFVFSLHRCEKKLEITKLRHQTKKNKSYSFGDTKVHFSDHNFHHLGCI